MRSNGAVSATPMEAEPPAMAMVARCRAVTTRRVTPDAPELPALPAVRRGGFRPLVRFEADDGARTQVSGGTDETGFVSIRFDSAGNRASAWHGGGFGQLQYKGVDGKEWKLSDQDGNAFFWSVAFDPAGNVIASVEGHHGATLCGAPIAQAIISLDASGKCRWVLPMSSDGRRLPIRHRERW